MFDRDNDLPRFFWIETEIAFEGGATQTHNESHELGITDADGGTIISYSDEFACDRAEQVADELGGWVHNVDFGYGR